MLVKPTTYNVSPPAFHVGEAQVLAATLSIYSLLMAWEKHWMTAQSGDQEEAPGS